MSSIGLKAVRLELDPVSYENLGNGCYVAMAGDVNRAARCRAWKSTTIIFAASRGTIRKRI